MKEIELRSKSLNVDQKIEKNKATKVSRVLLIQTCQLSRISRETLVFWREMFLPPTCKSFRNLPHFAAFVTIFPGKLSKILKISQIIFTNAWYSSVCNLFFFAAFFTFFIAICLFWYPWTCQRCMNRFDFWLPSLFFLCDEEFRKENEAKIAYARIIIH